MMTDEMKNTLEAAERMANNGVAFTSGEREVLDILIQHVRDTEEMLAGVDSIDFIGDFCVVQRFNGNFQAVQYDEDGTTIRETMYHPTALDAFKALKEAAKNLAAG
jgi:predicted SpoU family rRNA methylase